MLANIVSEQYAEKEIIRRISEEFNANDVTMETPEELIMHDYC